MSVMSAESRSNVLAAFWVEWLQLKSYTVRQTVTAGLVALMIVVLGKFPLSGIPPLIACMVTVSVLFVATAYDERNGWQSFRSAFPVSRSQIMTARALLVAAIAVGTTVTGLAIALVGEALAAMLGFAEIVFGVEELVITSLFGLAVAGVFASAMLPLFARFGMVRAFSVLPLIYVLACALLGFAATSFSLEPLIEFVVNGIFGGSIVVLASVAFLVGAAVYGACSLLSVRLYASREF